MRSPEQALVAFHHRRIHVPRVARVAGALSRQIGRAASVLDVGAGDGTVAARVAEGVGASRVRGVDVAVRPGAMIEVSAYDGVRLPFDDGAFEAVLVADVLHHCERPLDVLRECLRVASRVVAVKDHFRFGPVTEALLLWMDRAGNHAASVPVPGRYFSPASFLALVRDAGGVLCGLEWPLRIHDLPFRLVTRDELQFAARVERALEAAA